MTAVEEYREHRSLAACETENGLRILVNKADAAIAELEAEITRLAMENSHNIGKLDIERRLHDQTKAELAEALECISHFKQGGNPY